MSPLREEIESARREYAAIRYPGDLATELLPLRLRWKSLLAFGSLGAGSIAAAAVVAALMLRPLLMPASPHSNARLPLVENIPLARDIKLNLPSLPDVPAELRSLAPEPPSDLQPFWDDLHLPRFSQSSSEHA